MMNENRQLQLVAILSSICSSFVVLTLILFPRMRERLFMRIISFISLSDILGNIPYMTMVRPPNTSALCKLEGFVNLYFYPVAWMWTTILVYFLYGLAVHGKVPLSECAVQTICWGLPLVLSLLVLATNDYGRFDMNDDHEVCTIGGNRDSAFVWRIIIYYGLFLSCIATMIYLFINILRVQQTGLSAITQGMLQLAMQSLSLYPLAMILSWMPEFITFVVSFEHYNNTAFHISAIFKLSNGIFTSLIFFAKSQHARNLWWKCIFGDSNGNYDLLLQTRELSQDSGSCCLDLLDEYGLVDSERKISLISENGPRMTRPFFS